MLFTHHRMATTAVIGMTLVLSGCASGPKLSFPIALTKAIEGEVVSLNSVAQHGQTAAYQSARSVRTPQYWPQPGAQHGAQPVPQPVPQPALQHIAQIATMPPSQPVPFRSHPVERLRQPQRLPTYSHQRVTHQGYEPARHNQMIQQVGQQQQVSPPIVIQWDDHKQSAGSTRTTQSFSTSPTDITPHTMGQAPQPFSPPESLSNHVVHPMGDGCGEATPAVDFEKINQLVKRVEKMESDLSTSNQSIKKLTSSLASARIEISNLKRDADFWQSEVRRLEQSMQAQHRSDIASLNQISKVLETLLMEETDSTLDEEGPPDFDIATDPFAPVSR
ncbi:MAG: hypothetical protein ABJZ55_23730 [Fuerstiella sp.]